LPIVVLLIFQVCHHRPEMLKKQKVHLLLYLAECMVEFGPTPGFNSERYNFQGHLWKYWYGVYFLIFCAGVKHLICILGQKIFMETSVLPAGILLIELILC